MNSDDDPDQATSEGEDLIPIQRPIGISSDEDSEDEIDEEQTEQDRKFVISDEEDEDEEAVDLKSRKRKKKKQMVEDLDEEDLDLINDNLGFQRKKLVKLRKKEREVKVTDLNKMFSEDEQEVVVEENEDEFIASEDDDEPTFKPKRPAPVHFDMGIPEDVWRDIQDIFGDGTDYQWALDLQKGLHRVEEKKEIKISDVYEPSEIKAKMMTTEDEQFRTLDVPERYQIRDIKPLTDGEVRKAAVYITKQLLEERKDKTKVEDSPVFKVVFHVLRFFHNSLYEVPFVFCYRKDYVHPLLNHDDIWKVYDYDIQFESLQTRLSKLKKLFLDICSGSEKVKGIGSDPFIDRILNSISILSIEKLNDVHAYMNMKYGSIISAIDEQQKLMFKRSKRKTNYEQAVESRIDVFSKIFGLVIENFIQTTITHRNSHSPNDPTKTPEEAAIDFKSPLFPTPKAVLEAAHQFLAQEIASHPDLKQFIRSIYASDAIISIKPTEKGIKEIDKQHPYYVYLLLFFKESFKYIREKEITSFKDASFLLILQAESEGFITIDICLDAHERFVQDFNGFIVNDFKDEIAILWNEERKKVATVALDSYIFPGMTKWVKEKLSSEALSYIESQVTTVLNSKINMSGFKPNQKYNTVALTWDNKSYGACLCVDFHGNKIDAIELEDLKNKEKKIHQHDLIRKFLQKHSPKVVIVGGSGPETKTRFFTEIKETVQGLESELGDIYCFIVDDDVAKIYMDSKRAIKEFPGLTSMQRYCVSLARKVIDPTMEYAGLVNENDEIRLLNLHPLQRMLAEDKFKQIVTRCFMNVISTCGVDINLAFLYPHKSYTLQFVCGLGPRKSKSVIKKMGQTLLETRDDMVIRKLISNCVYLNCSGFIRIKAYSTGKRPVYVSNLLDDTRIHPEDYDLAQQMANDSIEAHDDEAVKRLLESEEDFRNEKVNSLDLQNFSVQLGKTSDVPKLLCLIEISKELISPYKELRTEFHILTPDEVFGLLTQETDEILYLDMLVGCRVDRVFERIARVTLAHSGLDGIIPAKFAGESSYVEDCQDVLQEGQFLNCCIMNINKETYQVELSLRKQDVEAAVRQMAKVGLAKRDRNFCAEWERVDESKREDSEKKTRSTEVKKIDHPFFQNFDFRGAQKYLENRASGDIVIRPSTKGSDHLSITWKVHKNIYQHIDIKEVIKANKKMYRIDDSPPCSDLDQLLEVCIYPVIRNIQEVIKCPKFKDYDYDAMSKFITQQAKTTRRSAYGLVFSRDKPGGCHLVYRHPENQLRNEYVGVKLDGFHFREKLFGSVEDLFNKFKRDESAKPKSK